jgi:hypothetical protein
MANDWQPTGPWKEKLRKALDCAFDEASMELLTADFFADEYRFSKVSPPGIGKTFQFRLHELLDQARMNDWLLDLVAAAHARRPKSAELFPIAEELGLTLAGPRLDNRTGKPLEEIIQANAKFINLAILREKLPLLEGQVCWIEIPGGGGTGFLVGPDLVVTNYHVIQRLEKEKASWQDVKCRFDFKQATDGTIIEWKKQTEVGLDGAKPLIHGQPPSEYDWNPTLGDPAPDETDCALLRLARRVGEEPIGGGVGDPLAQKRGWINATFEPPPLVDGNQIFLLQHPRGGPLQLSIGTVKEFNKRGTRIRYDANSKDGSSGSPCFNVDLQLVALHHARDTTCPPRWNQAIPFQYVRKLWRDREIIITAP